MESTGSQNRDTLEDSGMRFVCRRSSTDIVLRDQDTGIEELWVERDDYAGYVIEIDGVGYEFVRSLKPNK